MSNIKSIRERLGVTQTKLGEAMGCTQGNVGHYEAGQVVPPEAAKKLIAFAATIGHIVTYEQIYGAVNVKVKAMRQPRTRGSERPQAAALHRTQKKPAPARSERRTSPNIER